MVDDNLQNTVDTIMNNKDSQNFESQVKPLPNIKNNPQETSTLTFNNETLNSDSKTIQQLIIQNKPIVVIMAAMVITILLFAFRIKIFGPFTYKDCLKIDGSRLEKLEPKFCQTPNGKIFFENSSNFKNSN